MPRFTVKEMLVAIPMKDQSADRVSSGNMTHASATSATALRSRWFYRFRLLWVLLLFIPLSISLTIYVRVSRYTAAINNLAVEQKALDHLDGWLKELDRVIAEREQEEKTAEFNSGHRKDATPAVIKLSNDQLAMLKSQYEQRRKADETQRLELSKRKMAQEAALIKAERKVKNAHW